MGLLILNNLERADIDFVFESSFNSSTCLGDNLFFPPLYFPLDLAMAMPSFCLWRSKDLSSWATAPNIVIIRTWYGSVLFGSKVKCSVWKIILPDFLKYLDVLEEEKNVPEKEIKLKDGKSIIIYPEKK